MENKDLTAGKREAIFIFKNENKKYAEIAKLINISRISVYQGRTGSPNFGGIFFQGAPKKCRQNEIAKKKKKGH
jgi:hypothetical protein